MSYLDRYVSLPLNNKSKFTEFINEVLSDFYGTKFSDGEVLIYASTKLVGPDIIQNAIDMRSKTNTKKMLVITNSRFSQTAKDLAKDNWIMLMDEAVLIDVINQLDQGKRHGATIKENICEIESYFKQINTSKDSLEIDNLLAKIKANNFDLHKVNQVSHKMLESLNEELSQMQQFESDNSKQYGSKYICNLEPNNLLYLNLAERKKKYDTLIRDREDTKRFVRHIIERFNINQMKYEEVKEELENKDPVNLSPSQYQEYNELKTDSIAILTYQIDEMNRVIEYMFEVKQTNEKLSQLINNFKENDKTCEQEEKTRKFKLMITVLLLLISWVFLELMFGPAIATLITLTYLLIRQ